MAAHRCPFSSLLRGGAGGSACAVGPAAAESLGAREARSGAAVGVTCLADALGVAAALGRCLPALAMAPAEILSGKIVSAYVTRGGLPARPPARSSFPPSARRCGAQRGGSPGAGKVCGEPRSGTKPVRLAGWGCPGGPSPAGRENGAVVAFALGLPGRSRFEDTLKLFHYVAFKAYVFLTGKSY